MLGQSVCVAQAYLNIDFMQKLLEQHYHQTQQQYYAVAGMSVFGVHVVLRIKGSFFSFFIDIVSWERVQASCASACI